MYGLRFAPADPIRCTCKMSGVFGTHLSCWAAICLGALTLGCSTSDRRPYLQDPLLISKKPIEGRAQNAPPTLLAHADPAPPMGPGVSLASAPQPVVPTAAPAAVAVSETPVAVPAQTISTFTGAVDATPASRSETGSLDRAASVPATVAVERKIHGTYGNGPDYGWLQGVVDRHYRGHWYLRYCDPSVEDKNGGKVCLMDDPRLSQLKDGDVIFVEGEIVQEKEAVDRGPWHHYPRYQVRTLKAVTPQE
jgi:hypothetical protein